MYQIITTVTILSFIVLGILVGMYKFYQDHVAEPRQLEDELRDALSGHRPDVQALEPVRKSACAIAYNDDKVVVIRNFDKVKIYPIAALNGIEIFVDDRVAARVLRGGPHKMLDEITPQLNRVTMRLIFDDPSHPDFELVLWDPNDTMTARAEGPRAAMEMARRWFYHVEAIIRRPLKTPPPALIETHPAPIQHDVDVAKPTPPSVNQTQDTVKKTDASANNPKSEVDVLNAPIIPYM